VDRSDKNLRESTDELTPIDDLYDANQQLRSEVERLRAAIETAAAMVRNADPDLADALLRTLDRSKCR